MASKYLSLEEAAQTLGIDTDELVRLREKGEIRGFADRGSWKFRSQDVEEFKRSRQADSDPDVSLLDDEQGEGGDDESSSVLAEEDEIGEQPTLVRQGGADDKGASDSDVRLILDDSLTGEGDDSDADVSVSSADSDSDVRLVEDSSDKSDADSDSDVQLVGSESDSDVKLVGEGSGDDSDSDSDVRLVGDSQSPQQDGGGTSESSEYIPLAGEEQEASAGASADAGQAAQTGGEEKSEADDSGISLEAADSGISLEAADDSGISLDGEEQGEATVAEGATQQDELSGSIPTLGSQGDEDTDHTEFEVPSLDEDEDEGGYRLALDDEGQQTASASSGGEEDDETNVLMFDDEESGDEHSATVVKKGGGEDEADAFDLGGEEEFGEADEFGDEDELEVAADVVGEDDELDELEVFDAADEDFDETFEAGESQADFVPAAPGGAMAVPAEADWGTATFAGLAVSTVLMAFCGVLMVDLVHSIWGWDEPMSLSSTLIQTVSGLF